jgi:hypothetical protein
MNNPNEAVRTKAAKDYIRKLIEETDCWFIIEGLNKGDEKKVENICK